MYAAALLDHFANPRNPGELPAPALSVEVANPVCGDVLRMWARIEDGKVAAASFQAQGCTAAIAAGSALTVLLTGRDRRSAAALSKREIDEALGGLPAASEHAAVLAVDAVKALLRSWPD